MAGKYGHIDFKPPKSVADAAARGLELRKKNKGKGGLSTQQAKKEGVGSGVARAVSLKNRTNLSPSTVKRMKAFFDRHEKNKKADKGKSLSEDKGYISWMLWGGNSGRSWANKIVKQMESADKKANNKVNMKKTSLINAINLFYKIAQTSIHKNEEIKDKLEDICIPYIEKLYDKYINMPQGPQDDVVVINFVINVKLLKPNNPVINMNVSGNTEAITKWSDNVLQKNKLNLINQIKGLLKTYNPEIPFDADVKVERKY